MRHSGPDRARCARSTDVPRCYMTLVFFADTLRASFFVTRVAALLVPLVSLDAAAFGEIFFSATSVNLLRFSEPPPGRFYMGIITLDRSRGCAARHRPPCDVRHEEGCDVR